MRTFNDNLPCQSSISLNGINYKLKKLKPIEGGGFVFTVDAPHTEPDSVYLRPDTLKALYLLITSNEEKK